MDMVRAGIMLYGLAPSSEVMMNRLDLRQVMSLKVRITHVKEIEAGQSELRKKIHSLKRTKIASLPIGC